MRARAVLCGFVVSVLAVVRPDAQQPPQIFEEIAFPAIAPLTAPAVVAGRRASAIAERRLARMNLPALFDGTHRRVSVAIHAQRWVARLDRIEQPGGGHRTWVGELEGVPYSHVSLTERDGVVAGFVNAISDTYRVATIGDGTYAIDRIDASALGPELDPIELAPSPAVRGPEAPSAGDARTEVDVLLLYTPAVRGYAGGAAQAAAAMADIISTTNVVFSRSGVPTRVRLARAVEVPYREAPTILEDFHHVVSSPFARALRDEVGADLVQLVVLSADLTACGVASLFRDPSRVDFDAYSVADIVCAPVYTPTHEMAHNFGSHHAREDGASGALFPYSYGYKDRARGFRTVMAYACGGVNCPRIPQFSNPAVTYDGAVTGTPADNNAASIVDATAFVVNFRQRPATPAAPTNLEATVNGSQVTLSWARAADETHYALQVGRLPGESDVFAQVVGPVIRVSGTLPPATYFWRVIALGGSAGSATSSDAQFTVAASCTLPAAPQNLRFSLDGRLVTLSWDAPASGTPITYVLEAGSAPGAADLHQAATGGSAQSVTVTAPPGEYFVRIRAQNGCGSGPPSNEERIAVR